MKVLLLLIAVAEEGWWGTWGMVIRTLTLQAMGETALHKQGKSWPILTSIVPLRDTLVTKTAHRKRCPKVITSSVVVGNPMATESPLHSQAGRAVTQEAEAGDYWSPRI